MSEPWELVVNRSRPVWEREEPMMDERTERIERGERALREIAAGIDTCRAESEAFYAEHDRKARAFVREHPECFTPELVAEVLGGTR